MQRRQIIWANDCPPQENGRNYQRIYQGTHHKILDEFYLIKKYFFLEKVTNIFNIFKTNYTCMFFYYYFYHLGYAKIQAVRRRRETGT